MQAPPYLSVFIRTYPYLSVLRVYAQHRLVIHRRTAAAGFARALERVPTGNTDLYGVLRIFTEKASVAPDRSVGANASASVPIRTYPYLSVLRVYA